MFNELPGVEVKPVTLSIRPGTYLPRTPARIAIVGEAWGEQEAFLKAPFQGSSGKELRSILRQCNINPDDCIITNVINRQPPHNNFDFFCQKEKPDVVPFNIPIKPGLYLKPEYWDEVLALGREVADVNLIIALGNTALWATAQRPPKISAIRGTFFPTALGPKGIATWHPAAMLREYSMRPQMFADLTRAAAGQYDRKFSRPERRVYVAETRADVDKIREILLASSQYSIDTETCWIGKKKEGSYQLSCVGFSPSPDVAYVIPFTSMVRRQRTHYWANPLDEVYAWETVRRLCTAPIRKIFQNKLFDIFVLWRVMRIPVLEIAEDTMFIQHAMYPELPKSLAFLGSIYTDEPAWKLDRPKGGITGKAEE